MTEPVAIDWNDIATQLKTAFDISAKVAAVQRWDSERKPYYESMASLAEAMVKVSSEARAAREAADKENFKIAKP